MIDAIVATESRATPITAIAQTVPTLTGGKKCPFRGVVKWARFNAMLNSIYEAKVNRILKKEGKNPIFEALDSYGEHITPSLIEHDGIHYVQVLNPNYLEVEYFLNGQQVSNEDVEKWIRPPGKSRQGTQDRVKCKRYGVGSLKQITINGQVITNE